MRIRCLLTFFLLLAGGFLPAAPLVLENAQVRFEFSDRFHYALSRIDNKKTGRSVDFKLDKESDGLWSMMLLNSADGEDALYPSGKPEILRRNGSDENSVRLLWRDLKGTSGKVRVEVTVTLPGDSSMAEFSIDCRATGNPTPWIARVAFPRLNGISTLGDDYLIFGEQGGRIVRDPVNRLNGPIDLYHSGTWSSQMAAFFGSRKMEANKLADFDNSSRINAIFRGAADDETGLLVYVDDNADYHKTFEILPRKGHSFAMIGLNYPEFPAWPYSREKAGSVFEYKLPYRYRVGTFSGGIGEAAGIYRAALKDRPQFSRGPLRNPDGSPNQVSGRLLENVFWCKYYHAANKVVPEVMRMREYLQVPTSVHWYRYYINFFDDNNLDYFPLAPFFREGVNALKELGVAVAPYICCALWDPDTESYRRKGIAEAVAMDREGPYIWMLNGQPSHWMNPASKRFQQEYAELSRKFFGQIGVDAQYLDVMGTASKLSYNPNLGAIHGGAYWARGYRDLLDRMRRELSAIEPEQFLMAEGFSEDLVGRIDCFYGLDVTQSANYYPLFSLLYHDYAAQYASQARPDLEGANFRWILGSQFAAGSQLTYSSYLPLPPGTDGDGRDEFTRELAHAWYQSGNRFLNGGRGLETVLTTDPALAGNAPVAIVSPRYDVRLQTPRLMWQGTSVLGSAWAGHDGTIGITVANISRRECEIEIILNPDLAGPKTGTLWQTWPLPVRKIGATAEHLKYRTRIKSDGAMIFELRGDTAPAVTPLLENDRRFAVYDPNLKGGYRPQTVPAGTLWGSSNALLDNAFGDGKENTLSLISTRALRPLRVSAHATKWAQREGYGGPRYIDDAGFHVLSPTPILLSGKGSARVSSGSGATEAKIEMKESGAIRPAPGYRLILREAAGNFRTADGETALPAGVTFAVALPEEVAVDADAVAASLGAISRKYAESAVRLMRTESIMTAADRETAERHLRIGNAAAFLLTGGGRIATLIPHEWLLPNVPTLMKYALQDFHAKMEKSELEVLDHDLTKFVGVRKINDREFELKVNRIDAAANLAKVLYSVEFSANGVPGTMTNLAWEEIAEPLLVKLNQADCRKNYTPDTRRLSFTLKIINVSNTDLPIRIGAELPEGWVLGDGNRLEFPLKGLNSIDLPLTIEFRGEKGSSQELTGKFLVNNTPETWTQTEEEFTLIPRTSALRPVDPAAKTDPQFSNTRRNSCFAAILVGPDRKVSVDIEPVSIGGNTSFVDYTLMDSGMHVLKSGRLPFKDGKAAIETEVPAPGIYFLNFNSRFSRFRFNGINHYGYLAEAGSTYHFNGNMEGAKTTLYFYVKPGAKSFQFAGQDGGVPEPGRITIYSPDGKKLHDRFGAWSAGQWNTVEVPRGCDGKIWKVEVYAVDDFDLMFRGDGVSRWLSLTPGAVITD